MVLVFLYVLLVLCVVLCTKFFLCVLLVLFVVLCARSDSWLKILSTSLELACRTVGLMGLKHIYFIRRV